MILPALDDGKGGKPKRKMIKELEKEIRDLQKELADAEKEQGALRLQPCRGDSELRDKDAKIEGLAQRAVSLRDSIRTLTRKRQLLISEGTKRG